MDLALVAVGARMVGSLVGTRLADHLPGVKVFGGNQIDQSLWLVCCSSASPGWLRFSKIALQLAQERVTV